MDSPRINRALARLASEIVEENHGAGDLYLVGIRRRGVPLAERMADKIADLEGDRPPVGIVDITLYRDDLSTVGAKPIVNRTDLPGDIENRNIVLIDDVLYTGRTIRAALDQLIDFGRPTNKGMTICGKTTTSRNGNRGNSVCSVIMEVVMAHLIQNF